MWHVVSKKQPDQHRRHIHYGLEFPDQETKKILSELPSVLYNINGPFENSVQMDEFIDWTTYQNIKNYTKKVREEGFPNQITHFVCCFVFAYVGSDATPYPGIYRVALDDFVTLKHNFSSITLAQDSEMENYIDGYFIVNRNDVTDILTNLNLFNTFFLPECIPHTDKKKYENILNSYILSSFHLLDKITNLIKYSGILKHVENLIKSSKITEEYKKTVDLVTEDYIKENESLAKYLSEMVPDNAFIKNRKSVV